MSTPCCRITALLARAAAVAFALLSFAGGAWADDDPPGRVGRLADIQGTVWVFSPDDNEWIGAVRNRPVTTGDRIATDRNARAELRVGSTTVRLDGQSELEVLRLDDERMHWQLHEGSMAARLHSRANAREFEVVTREGRFMPQQGGHYRVDRDDDTSVATVWSGSLRFEGEGQSLVIEQGQRAELWNDGTTRYSLSDSQPDAFSDWVAAREREEERLAAAPYVSPEMTGAEDLGRHGHWHEHTEYGPLWVPAVVMPGWAPYRYGHWAFIRPWGWTWVDDAPWGFAPFHYGRWVHFRGAWGWAPGRYVARPVYAPALVAWIGGPRIGLSVRIGSAPKVGWFPLGPREVYVPGYRASRGYVRNVNITHVTNITNITNIVNQPGKTAHGHRYVNRHVPDAVTVVPEDVVRQRRPVAPVAVRALDERSRRELVQRPVTYTPPVGVPAAGSGKPAVRPPASARRGEGPGAGSRAGRDPLPAGLAPSQDGIEPGIARRTPSAPDSARNGGARGGDARTDDARAGDARNGDARNGDARNGDARNGDARNGDARNGDARNGDARNGDARTAERGAPPRRIGTDDREPRPGVTARTRSADDPSTPGVVLPPAIVRPDRDPPAGTTTPVVPGSAPSVRPDGAPGAPSVRPGGIAGAPSVRPGGTAGAPSVRPEGAMPLPPRALPEPRPVPGVRPLPHATPGSPGFRSPRDGMAPGADPRRVAPPPAGVVPRPGIPPRSIQGGAGASAVGEPGATRLGRAVPVPASPSTSAQQRLAPPVSAGDGSPRLVRPAMPDRQSPSAPAGRAMPPAFGAAGTGGAAVASPAVRPGGAGMSAPGVVRSGGGSVSSPGAQSSGFTGPGTGDRRIGSSGPPARGAAAAMPRAGGPRAAGPGPARTPR
jgi:hypothetical protein